ncbi:MAG: anhydro-N-acetylmuramic acid kinase [Gammaproteobacteria bacterium]|nr:anhydro-N-acetylmuramic acid kinase [Gammaproteobacteria bacterium]
MLNSTLYIGLMSGTSMDGVDAALVDFSDRCKILSTTFVAYPANIRNSLHELVQPDGLCVLDDLGNLDQWLGHLFGQAAVELIEQSGHSANQIAAIGSHGQTIRHRPSNYSSGHIPYTMQIGDPNVIAETTGITTVADFRRRDMAAGGQGAPLVPGFHAAVFGVAGEDRVIINIGGIANITVINADESIYGFDIGPGNCLMDRWTQQSFKLPYDTDGQLAAEGTISSELLQCLLEDPYFNQPHPKSTGPEYFNLNWLGEHLMELNVSQTDVLRTLNQLTAVTIADVIKHHSPNSSIAFCCGGGVHNSTLMNAIKSELPDVNIDTTAKIGIDPDFVEAAAFAWLAKQTLAKKPGNTPQVTGAGKTVILGGVYFS